MLAVLAAVVFGTAAVAAVPAFASGMSITVNGRTLLGPMARPSYKPKRVTVSGHVVTGIRWHHWNSARAVGFGTSRFQGRRLRATLIASSRAYCSTRGAYLYDNLQLRLG